MLSDAEQLFSLKESRNEAIGPTTGPLILLAVRQLAVSAKSEPTQEQQDQTRNDKREIQH